jgi:hypothetical protein
MEEGVHHASQEAGGAASLFTTDSAKDWLYNSLHLSRPRCLCEAGNTEPVGKLARILHRKVLATAGCS